MQRENMDKLHVPDGVAYMEFWQCPVSGKADLWTIRTISCNTTNFHFRTPTVAWGHKPVTKSGDIIGLLCSFGQLCLRAVTREPKPAQP